MEFLINDLREKLLLRKKAEIAKAQQYGDINNKDLLLISSGKVFELDHLIGCLDKMLNYNDQTKKIAQ